MVYDLLMCLKLEFCDASKKKTYLAQNDYDHGTHDSSNHIQYQDARHETFSDR